MRSFRHRLVVQRADRWRRRGRPGRPIEDNSFLIEEATTRAGVIQHISAFMLDRIGTWVTLTEEWC
jgi:hypothetical protein